MKWLCKWNFNRNWKEVLKFYGWFQTAEVPMTVVCQWERQNVSLSHSATQHNAHIIKNYLRKTSPVNPGHHPRATNDNGLILKGWPSSRDWLASIQNTTEIIRERLNHWITSNGCVDQRGTIITTPCDLSVMIFDYTKNDWSSFSNWKRWKTHKICNLTETERS